MSNEVTKSSSNQVVEFKIKELSAKAAEQLKGIKLEYPQLKIPTGGALFFEVDEEPVKEILGVIIHHGPRNVYYATEFDGSNNPPDCFSKDGEVGYERIPDAGPEEAQYNCKNCRDCPYSKFGSDNDGRGKACKEKHQLYILSSDRAIPFSFLLPVSSTGPLNSYATKLFNQGKFLNEVLTSFTLEKATSKTNIVYSKLVLKKVRDLTDEEIEVCEKKGQAVIKDVENG